MNKESSLEEQITAQLMNNDKFSITSSNSLELNQIHSVMKKLSDIREIEFSIHSIKTIVLTEEGSNVVEHGSPEFNVLEKVKSDEVELSSDDELYLKYCYQNKWISKNKDGSIFVVENEPTDIVKNELVEISMGKSTSNIKKLIMRKYCKEVIKKTYEAIKGQNFNSKKISEISNLTADHLSLDLSNVRFKPFNFDTLGLFQNHGSLHPLLKMKDEIRNIFLKTGFHEMATNQFVESSFWNFDTLFQPQNHPTRDSHDTFFVSHPKYSQISFEDEYVRRIRDVHEKCHKYEWMIEESRKNILRTHTTAVSARYLFALKNHISKNRNLNDLNNIQAGKGFEPIKLFSIDKVFRNETVDATHLAEFHQVEGLIAGYDLSLGDLMGVLEYFYKQLGISNIKFKPTSNPYTEPSMEVFGYHDGLKKWIELGNSGIFRPEMLIPMGFSEDVTVLAWGLSVERLAMISYKINNIRELVGFKVDLGFIRNSGILFMK